MLSLSGFKDIKRMSLEVFIRRGRIFKDYMGSEHSLVIKNLSKQYRLGKKQFLTAVDDISFEVNAGECFGLLGPNGAGKSTTISCITGFFPPTSGEVKIYDLNVFDDPKAARQLLGYCPQDETLDTDFNVIDQMVQHATFFKIPLKEGKSRSENLLKKFHLEDKAKALIPELSGGMRRRLQVARSLVSNPSVLVLDEPSTGLDPEARRVLWSILHEYKRQGIAILLSTHYMEEAERLCDRIAIMHNGKILDIGSSSELIKRHMHESEIVEEVRPGVHWKRPPNLEDVFLKITGIRLDGNVDQEPSKGGSLE